MYIVPVHLGLKIKLARVAKGLTQQDLADKINKTRPLVSHIEQTGKVNHYTLRVICEALEISVQDLEENRHVASEPSVDTEVVMLQNELKVLKKENEMLKQIIQEQKKFIAQLQKR